MTSKSASEGGRRPLVGVSFKMYFDIPKTHSYLDETLSLTQLVGLVVAVVGVGAATRTRRTPVPVQDVGTQ